MRRALHECAAGIAATAACRRRSNNCRVVDVLKPDTVAFIVVVAVAAAAVAIGMEAPYVGVLFALAGLSIWQADMAGMYRAVPDRGWRRGGRVAAACTVCMLPAYAVFLFWWHLPGDVLMAAAVLYCFVRTAPRVIPLGIACVRRAKAGAA